MRREAEGLLGMCTNFRSIDGTAEKTGLSAASVDLVSAGQAFHWFDKPGAKKEFSRILKPPGFVLLVWNTRDRQRGTFSYDYEELVERHKSDSAGWASSRLQIDQIREFFGNSEIVTAKLDNKQELDFEQLLARIRSASYMPKAGREFENLKEAAKSVFARYQLDGLVTMNYTTEVYFGKI